MTGELDSYTTGLVGAFSMSRRLLTAYVGDLYTDAGSGNISNLKDQSGNVHDMVQATTGQQPDAIAAGGGFPVLARFDDTDDLLVGPANDTLYSGSSVYIITTLVLDGSHSYSNSVPINSGFNPGAGQFNSLILSVDSTGTQQEYTAVGSEDQATSGLTDGDEIVTVEMYLDGTDVAIRVNGISWATEPDGTDISDSTAAFNIGEFIGVSAAPFDLLELAIYDVVPNDTDKDAIQAIFAGVAGGGDDLLADSIESISEVSSPAIGQAHVLNATDVESASEVSVPAIGQGHGLNATDVESASQVGSPSIGQIHNLSTDSVESASQVTTPQITQEGVLVPEDIESASQVSIPGFGQAHALLADSVQSTSEVTTPALTILQNLLANSIESASEVTNPVLALTDNLLSTSIESASEVGTPDIGQLHSLLANSVQSTSELSVPSIDQTQGLTANSIESGSEVSAPVLAIPNIPINLDDYTTGLTGVWSMSRPLLSAYLGVFFDGITTCSSWKDQSGNNRDLDEPTVFNQPDISAASGGLPVRLTYGSGTLTALDSAVGTNTFFSSGTGYGIFSLRMNSVSTDRAFINLGNVYRVLFSDADGEMSLANVMNPVEVNVSAPTEELITFEFYIDGSEIAARVDGGAWTTTATALVADTPNILNLGAFVALPTQSDILEMAFYETIPSDDDKDDIQRILAAVTREENELFAESIESASQVSAPIVGQIHDLTPDDVESASEVSSPAITNALALFAESIQSLTQVTNPTLGQKPQKRRRSKKKKKKTMSNQIPIVRRGESFPFEFDLNGNSIQGYTCTINVKMFDSDASLITRVIEPTGDTWEGFLTSTETDSITTVGTYRLIGLIVNTSTDKEQQQTKRFNLTEPWA